MGQPVLFEDGIFVVIAGEVDGARLKKRIYRSSIYEVVKYLPLLF